MKEYFLIYDRGSGPNTVHPLVEQVTIGRTADNAITLTDKTVSRNHARISLLEGAWTVEDLNSANSIIFKGKRVNKVVLASGDTFQIGDFTFRFAEANIPEARDQYFETITIL